MEGLCKQKGHLGSGVYMHGHVPSKGGVVMVAVAQGLTFRYGEDRQMHDGSAYDTIIDNQCVDQDAWSSSDDSPMQKGHVICRHSCQCMPLWYWEAEEECRSDGIMQLQSEMQTLLDHAFNNNV